MTILKSVKPNTKNISEALEQEFRPANLVFEITDNAATMKLTLIVFTDRLSDGNVYENIMDVDESWLAREPDVDASLFGLMRGMAHTLIADKIPEEVIGAYPFARMWHDKHARKGPAGYLTYRPHMDVPGWVFGSIKKKGSEFPTDKPRKGAKGYIPVGYRPVQVIDEGIPVSPKIIPSANPVQEAQITKLAKEVAMAASTKKRVVRKAPIPGFDPTKVKTPECKEHRTPMQFDHVEQKWRCTYDGCGMVARPKRDADDKTVMLGKGGIQMRLIAQEGNISVVLISDDNVALNITPLVDVEQILDLYDVKEQAKIAAKNGTEIFDITQPQRTTIMTRLLVMGASELTE